MTSQASVDDGTLVTVHIKPDKPLTLDEIEEHNKTIDGDDAGPQVGPIAALGRIFREYGHEAKCSFYSAFIFSFLAGVGLPFAAVVMQIAMELMYKISMDPSRAGELVWQIFGWFMGNGIIVGALYGLYFYFWGRVKSRLGQKVRKVYFELLIAQEIGYHDKFNSGELNTRLTSETSAISEAISEKMGMFVMQLVCVVVGLGLGFYYCWQIALVMIGASPLVAIAGIIQAKLIEKAGSKDQDIFAKAGAISQEVLQQMRTVVSYNYQAAAFEKYGEQVNEKVKLADKESACLGLTMGYFWFSMIGLMYGICMVYGAYLISVGETTLDRAVGAMFGLVFGMMGIGQTGAGLQEVLKGGLAAARFFRLKDRVPLIKPGRAQAESGRTLREVKGRVELNNVVFSYPDRETAGKRGPQVIKGISLKAETGKSLALVGPSGCGKSTIVSLLQRFYEPDSGSILVDGTPIEDFDLPSLRDCIGLVEQQPVLFDMSIKDNIKIGKPGATDEEVYEAARIANADGFIRGFPKGYDTPVGELGTTMSGGQRQRIAIARAMLKRPKILLLDEATSALDNQSEREVQAALDKITATTDLTVIVIAHRLSTVRDCDTIAVIVGGEVLQAGSHAKLMTDRDGLYHAMVRSQDITGVESRRSRSRVSR